MKPIFHCGEKGQVFSTTIYRMQPYSACISTECRECLILKDATEITEDSEARNGRWKFVLDFFSVTSESFVANAALSA
ncbi:hypothetical protein N9153_03295 [Planctomicrobium sp.]|nr:hypothetical protein [Planctomicrobium sp.]